MLNKVKKKNKKVFMTLGSHINADMAESEFEPPGLATYKEINVIVEMACV